jgi:dipeptidyl aminopeptidase/acylaminoacyl peptidase
MNEAKDVRKRITQLIVISGLLALPVLLTAGCLGETSPSKIAFASDRDGSYEIYVMNSDGSNQTRLTNSSEGGDPCWSPDGTKIAFHSLRDGNYEIYVMNADGSNQIRLTDNQTTDVSPSWSPDADSSELGKFMTGYSSNYFPS